MKFAICDDEPKYLELIEKCIKFYCMDNNIKFSCENYSSGEELLENYEDFDVVFLDVEMKKINGIETAAEIKKKNRNTIIFVVTAFRKYLDDAMDQEVFRYIDKPIDSERIYKGLDRALQQLSNKEFSFSTTENKRVKINKNDIVFVEVELRKVVVHTVTENYVSREKMDYYRDNLSTSNFAAPHNSYLININHIINYTADHVVMRDGSVVPIAQKRQHDMRIKFMDAMRDDLK